MESYLYLCTKSKEGEFIPFFRINGSYATCEADDKGGSVFNMEYLISNINSKKFEDKIKKTEILQNSLNDKESVEEKIEVEESVSDIPQYKGGKKEKKEDRVMATLDLADSITEYLEHN